jgi:hypothetical protein
MAPFVVDNSRKVSGYGLKGRGSLPVRVDSVEDRVWFDHFLFPLIRVKPRRKLILPPAPIFAYTNNHDQAIKNCTQKIEGPSGWRQVRRNDSRTL